MTTVKQCNCKNEYQDRKYGKGMRVKNSTNKTVGTESVYRCTVCGK